MKRIRPLVVVGAPVTAGGSIAVDAGAIAGGAAMMTHGGSVMGYMMSKDKGGGGSSNSGNSSNLPNKDDSNWTKLKGDQGWKDVSGNMWKKDQLHKDHWDVSDKKGNKIKEVDFEGRELWPSGPKNKNKTP